MPKVAVHSCPDCKRHLRNKHKIASKRYAEEEGQLDIYQCACGAIIGVFRYDDDSKNINYKTKQFK